MAKNQVSEAEKKVAAAEKKKDKKPANPNGNWFQRAGKAIKKFFKDVKGEVKKIVWPDGKTVFKSTLVVLAVVAICGAAIFGVDQLLSVLLSLLKKAAQAVAEKSASSDTETTTAAIIALKSFFLG
jgi:preprotein translocase subunit SecE